MAKETAPPALNSEDIAVLLGVLRKSGRPMTSAELVAALREASTNR